MSLSGDTYADNILSRMRDLERRLAALERRPSGGQKVFFPQGDDAYTASTPDGMLPLASSIPRLFVVAQNSGNVYEIMCEDEIGPGLMAKLRLDFVGRVRMGE